jgi:hypothetical protein
VKNWGKKWKRQGACLNQLPSDFRAKATFAFGLIAEC